MRNFPPIFAYFQPFLLRQVTLGQSIGVERVLFRLKYTFPFFITAFSSNINDVIEGVCEEKNCPIFRYDVTSKIYCLIAKNHGQQRG